MVNITTARELALAFPDTDEHLHFNKKAFRVKKKIFASLDEKNKRITVKLSLIEQSVFCTFDKAIIYPVPGAWGKQGYSIIELSGIKKNMLKDALTVAYCRVAPKKLAAQFIPHK